MMGMRHWSVAAVIVGMLLANTLWAQNNLRRNSNIPLNLYPPHLRPTVQLSEEEQRTIDRSLEDLKSDNIEFRAGAVMLLGKYEASIAREAVVKALSDPHERVRRAALVSVSEWSRTAPASAVEPVLKLLGDGDVEIRRMASSSLQNMMSVRQMARMTGFGRNKPREFSASTKQVILDAFFDEDVIVRRNMLKQYSVLGFRVPAETFLKLLKDVDRQVRVTALPLASRFADSDAFLKASRHLVEDEDKAIRLRLIRETFMHDHEQSLGVLRELAQDADLEVAAEAELWIFQATADPELFKRIFQRYRNRQLTSAQSTRMIQLAPTLREKVDPYLYQLIEADDSVVRLEAIRLFLDRPLKEEDSKYLLQFINDRSPNVRNQCVEYFHTNPDALDKALVEELVYSEHVDLRRFLIYFSENLPVAERNELLLELILDEDTQIRSMALGQLGRNKVEGWRKIMEASLKDPNTEIQKVAVSQLISSRDAEARIILKKYIERKPNAPLSSYIRRALMRSNSFQAL